MKAFLIFGIICCGFFMPMKGQDIHFTQWMHAPHTYNPAEIGNFSGDYRFHGNHRNQWSSVTVPFTTFAIMADSRKLVANEKVAVGANVIYDVVGDSKFSTTGISLGASYTLSLGKNSPSQLSFGVQPSITQKKLDLTNLNFDNQYNGLYFDPSLPVNESLTKFSRWYLDLAMGSRLFLHLNPKNSLETGVSLYNVMKPKQSFYSEDDIRLDRRSNTYIKLNHVLRPKLLLQPSILYYRQGTFSALNAGASLYYDISETKYFTKKVFAGLYGRGRDSGNLLVGLMYGNWTFGGSYDFNLSTLVPASNFKGGIEFAVIYVIRSGPKKPVYKSCPPYL